MDLPGSMQQKRSGGGHAHEAYAVNACSSAGNSQLTQRLFINACALKREHPRMAPAMATTGAPVVGDGATNDRAPPPPGALGDGAVIDGVRRNTAARGAAGAAGAAASAGAGKSLTDARRPGAERGATSGAPMVVCCHANLRCSVPKPGARERGKVSAQRGCRAPVAQKKNAPLR